MRHSRRVRTSQQPDNRMSARLPLTPLDTNIAVDAHAHSCATSVQRKALVCIDIDDKKLMTAASLSSGLLAMLGATNGRVRYTGEAGALALRAIGIDLDSNGNAVHRPECGVVSEPRLEESRDA